MTHQTLPNQIDEQISSHSDQTIQQQKQNNQNAFSTQIDQNRTENSIKINYADEHSNYEIQNTSNEISNDDLHQQSTSSSQQDQREVDETSFEESTKRPNQQHFIEESSNKLNCQIDEHENSIETNCDDQHSYCLTQNPSNEMSNNDVHQQSTSSSEQDQREVDETSFGESTKRPDQQHFLEESSNPLNSQINENEPSVKINCDDEDSNCLTQNPSNEISNDDVHQQSTSSSQQDQHEIDETSFEESPKHPDQQHFLEESSNPLNSQINENETSVKINCDDENSNCLTENGLNEINNVRDQSNLLENQLNNEDELNVCLNNCNLLADERSTIVDVDDTFHSPEDKCDQLQSERDIGKEEMTQSDLSVNTNEIDHNTINLTKHIEIDDVEMNCSSVDFVSDEIFEEKRKDEEDLVYQPIELKKDLFEEMKKKSSNNVEQLSNRFPSTSIALESTLQNTFLVNPDNKQEIEPTRKNCSSIQFEEEDILGNKSLIKKTIESGKVNRRPTRSTLATVSYQMFLVDNFTSNIRLIEQIQNETFFVGECDIISAIDICVQSMNEGEKASIDSDIRHCYGQNGCQEKEIPPFTSENSYRMKIDLEFHQWIGAPDVQTLSIEERLYWGDKKREMGNFYYRRQDYSNCLQCYRGALRFLDQQMNPILNSSSADAEKQSIFIERYIQVENNVAQVNLHLNRYESCLNSVENVLKFDRKNTKALFRQGKAFFQLGKYDQALHSLKQLQRTNSSDTDQISEMIRTCETKLANYDKNEKEIYRRMFQPPPPSTTATTTRNQQRVNQIEEKTNNWWAYLALGSAVLALMTFAVIKSRKA